MPVWWKGGLTRKTASVMVDWNRDTFCLVDGLAHEDARGWMD